MILILIYSLILYAVINYIYCAILLPGMHLRLRYRLFAARDRACRLMLDKKTLIPDKQYELLHDSINSVILLMPFLDIGTFIRSMIVLRGNKDLRKSIDERAIILDECRSEEFRQIRWEIGRIISDGFSANLGFLIFLKPLLLYIFDRVTSERPGKVVTSVSTKEVSKFTFRLAAAACI